MNWAYDPIAQSENGNIKVIMGRVQEEEIKIVCDGPKYIRGEKSSRKHIPEVIKTILSSWTFFKVVSQRGVKHWIRDEQREETSIFKSYSLHIKCPTTNSLAALMGR